jgi:hypothetical protein
MDGQACDAVEGTAGAQQGRGQQACTRVRLRQRRQNDINILSTRTLQALETGRPTFATLQSTRRQPVGSCPQTAPRRHRRTQSRHQPRSKRLRMQRAKILGGSTTTRSLLQGKQGVQGQHGGGEHVGMRLRRGLHTAAANLGQSTSWSPRC